MDVSVENTGELGRRLKVAVPAEEIDPQVSERIRELGREVKLKGFRPGRVPFNVLQQRFGAEVRKEVVNQVLQQSFQDAVNQENLRPASTPEITAEGRDRGKDLTYTAEFEVYPEIEGLDVSVLNLERPVAEVSNQDVDHMIETLRQQRSDWEPVDRGAAEGDRVMFAYSLTAGEARFPAEGTDRAGTIIGSDAIMPGLDDALRGLKKDDATSAELSVPEGFRDAGVAGRTAQARLEVLGVSEPRLPELDEEFIRSFGITSGDLDEFKGEVRNNLERELKLAVTENMRRQVVDGLLAHHKDLNLPESLINEEAERLANQARDAGSDAPESNTDDFRDKARERVAAGFLLSELARQNEIEMDSERVRTKLIEIASTYQQPEEVMEAYQNNPQLQDQIRGAVLEEQVADWIVDHATVTDKPVSFDELLRPAG